MRLINYTKIAKRYMFYSIILYYLINVISRFDYFKRNMFYVQYEKSNIDT